MSNSDRRVSMILFLLIWKYYSIFFTTMSQIYIIFGHMTLNHHHGYHTLHKNQYLLHVRANLHIQSHRIFRMIKKQFNLSSTPLHSIKRLLLKSLLSSMLSNSMGNFFYLILFYLSEALKIVKACNVLFL